MAGVALALTGLSLVRNSTVGRYEEALLPTDPGYEAYVVPTPTFAVVHRGPDGALAGLALLSLEVGDDGGTVVVVPPALLADRAPTATTRIADVYRQDGEGGAVAALSQALGTAVSDSVHVDDAHWARLVEPVAPIEVSLPEPVGEWPADDVRLEPDQVGRFLAALDPGETDIDRIERQQLFWAAWLNQVREGGRDAVPGEESTGLGRFVRAIAGGPGRALELPIAATTGRPGSTCAARQPGRRGYGPGRPVPDRARPGEPGQGPPAQWHHGQRRSPPTRPASWSWGARRSWSWATLVRSMCRRPRCPSPAPSTKFLRRGWPACSD